MRNPQNKTEDYWRMVERHARAEMWGWIIFSSVCLVFVVFMVGVIFG